ncbi:hypothetical protein GW17_00026728 [Ensete ventricosum]|nr:hypothetical protein GW17_00026728 [Ensete ventricosum]RZR83287.1 hypothetical protein BHM03_00009875 [Ensete ventricosum]
MLGIECPKIGCLWSVVCMQKKEKKKRERDVVSEECSTHVAKAVPNCCHLHRRKPCRRLGQAPVGEEDGIEGLGSSVGRGVSFDQKRRQQERQQMAVDVEEVVTEGNNKEDSSFHASASTTREDGRPVAGSQRATTGEGDRWLWLLKRLRL